MSPLRLWISDRADDALALGGALFGVFALVNLLYGAKMLAGIDLLPGHYGSYLPAGSAFYEALSGR